MVEEQQVDLEGCLDSAGVAVSSPSDLHILPGAYQVCQGLQTKG